jgi:putative flippase GtrA
MKQLLRAGGFPRFLLVGLLNTLFGYGLFCAVLAATQRTMLSLTVSTILGVLFNYGSIGALVFGARGSRRLWRFVGVYAVLFVVNASVLLMLQRLGASPVVAQAGLLLPLAAMSFALNRRFVFDIAQDTGA